MSRTARAINLYFLLLGLFVLHRVLAWPFLMSGFEQAHDNYAQIFFVGLLSDQWIAALGALFVWLVGMIIGRAGFMVVGYMIAITVSIIVTLHQPYTQFFHFQIIPYHLRYLSDGDFVKANATSILGWRSMLLAAAGTSATWWFGRSRIFASYGRKALYAVAVPMVVFAAIGHAINIHYRVQLFIPENLQMNLFEKLFMEATKSRIVPRLTHAQIHQLAARVGGEAEKIASGNAREAAILHAIMSHRVADARPTPLLTAIKSRLEAIISRGEKPLIMVVLAESLRTAEVGAYGSGHRPSITPQLDQLIGRGVAFRSAYSTGTVTRGAQEAALCGYLGGMSTSLMRNRPDVRVKCLPEVVRDSRLPGDKRAMAFWHHAGEGRFDGQLSFWTNRGMQNVLSFKDFPRNTPQTDWGYSDLALVATSQQKIAAMRSRRDVDIVYGALLTVTNHIPWALPSDTPANLPSRGLPDMHESWHTTSYSDHAIGELVRGLRESQLWSRTVMVITGDHGNLLPAYQRVTGKKTSNEELQTHVPLVLSGGITETVLEGMPSLSYLSGGHWYEPYVSQADIAPLVAYLLGLADARFFGELPLAGERTTPVVADLGQSVYAPRARLVLTDRDFLNPRLDRAASEKDYLTLYYRGFLEFIGSMESP